MARRAVAGADAQGDRGRGTRLVRRPRCLNPCQATRRSRHRGRPPGLPAARGGAASSRLDGARCVRELVDVHDPPAERIVLVMAQLTPHASAARAAAFPPAEAKRLADKPELPFTPQHGSRPNMAGLELGIRERQCPRRRRPDRAAMERGVAAWAARRNAAARRIDGQFTAADARTQLRRLYPAIEP